MAKNILISGATGLVGQHLIPLLQRQGHHIRALVRKETTISGVQTYVWDVEQQYAPLEAFENIDTIIHLAGAGIADRRWTNARKKQLIDSRVASAQLLYKCAQQCKAPLKTFITASAVGYYGDRGEEFLTEDSNAGKDFLAKCCLEWEKAAKIGISLGVRVVQIRLGLILSKAGGVLQTLEKPIHYYVGAPLGNGKQWMPWIHLTDVVRIFIKAVTDERMFGPYNACAPSPVNNKVFTQALAKKLNRPCWPFQVPAFILKLILGERSILPLMSSNIIQDKLPTIGFTYQYVKLENALDECYY